MPQLVPVDGDPFAAPSQDAAPVMARALVPIDHDPFGDAATGQPAAWHAADDSDVRSGVMPGERVIDVGRGRRISATPAGPDADTRPGMGESAVRGAWQGATFNFGDEMQGAAAASPFAADYPYLPGLNAIAGGARLAAEKVAPGVFGEGGSKAYDAEVARTRALNEAARAANPGSFMAGELAGGLAGAVAMPGFAPARAAAAGSGAVLRTAAPIADAMLTGAGYGSLAGLGAGEGTVADRLPSAAAGAGTGAIVGGALGTAGAAIGKPAGYVADHVNAWRNPQALADRMVARNVQRDAADLPAIAQRMEDAGAVNPRSPLTLADAAGPNTQGIAGTIARTPGEGRAPARNFLEDRHLGSETEFSQADRIYDRIGRLLGDQQSASAAEGIIANRTAQSRPAYEAAFARDIDYASPAGRELRALLDRVPNEVRANANRIHTIEDTAGNQLTWGHIPDRHGMFPLQAVPNSRQWDYIKRGLDTAVERHTNPAGELDTTGNALNGLRREIVSATNAANPALANARKVFAGQSELLDALRSGQNIWRPGTSADAVRREMGALSPGEAEMYRLGAANALRERVAGSPDGANKVRFVNGSPTLRDKLRVVAPDERSYGAVMKFLADENAMATTRVRATGGSQTAERLAEDAGVGHDLVESAHTLKNIATGHVTGLLTQAARHLSKLDPEKRGAVLDEARKIILNPDPQAVRAFAVRMSQMPGDKTALGRFRADVLRAVAQTAATEAGRKR